MTVARAPMPYALVLPLGRRVAAVIALLLTALLVALAPARAQTFPKFTGFVVDDAHILSPAQAAAITARLDALQKQTNRQLVVATIPDLQGYAIEDYGYRLGRAWAVGLKGVDNGAILIVAPKERRVRVEVGYGLTPVLTDAFSGLVIRNQILPAFKANDMPGGISAGVDALAAQLRLPDDIAKAKVAESAKAWDAANKRAASNDGGIPFSLLFWLFILCFVGLAMLRGRRGGQSFGGSALPIFLWGAGLGGGGGGWGGGHGGGSFGGGGGDDGGGGWGGGGFTGGGGGSFGGGGASGSW